MANMKIGGRSYSDPGQFSASELLGSARALEKVTKGTALVNGACRGLWVGTAGSLNLTDFEGTVHTAVPVFTGYNPIMAQSIEAGGTATDIWAMY